MTERKIYNRLSLRLTAAFLLAATMGIVLMAIVTYRTTSSDFTDFLGHVEAMQGMMGGGGMMGGTVNQAAIDFIDNLGRTFWLVGLLSVALALLLGWLFTRQIVAPVEEISTAARRISKGDLSPKVRPRGADEFADLGRSFNTMSETLARDRQLRQNMVADIAHELRTPLSVLRADIEAMQDGVLEPNQENLASLHQETAVLSRLVNDLRTLSLAESGQLEYAFADTDIGALCSRIYEGMTTRFQSKNIDLELEVPGNVPPVRADADRIEQVIRNLLNNAYRYTPEDGHVTLRLAVESRGVVVSVVDTGRGIEPEDLLHVFERFYRVDRSRARRTGGSGLGLAIVKQLVEAHGGRVWATSQVGRGSTFSFYLPFIADSELKQV